MYFFSFLSMRTVFVLLYVIFIFSPFIFIPNCCIVVLLFFWILYSPLSPPKKGVTSLEERQLDHRNIDEELHRKRRCEEIVEVQRKREMQRLQKEREISELKEEIEKEMNWSLQKREEEQRKTEDLVGFRRAMQKEDAQMRRHAEWMLSRVF